MTALDHANISYQVGEQLGLPLVFCGPDGAVRSMTAAAVDMLGTAAAAGAGGFLALLTAAGVDDSERVLALSCREPAEIWLQRGGRRLSVELRGHRDGAQSVVYSLLPGTVTEEQEARRAEFQSLIAHDIRSPLAVIQGYAGLLTTGQAGPLTETQREFLAGVDDKISELVRLLDDFLDYQRLEAGALPMQLEAVPLAELGSQVVDEYRSRAARRGLSLEFDSPASAPMALADPLRLRQVLDNLLGNAVKYAAQNSWVRVTVAGDGPSVRLVVADGGPGLPSSELAALFDPYQRSQGHRHIQGTGLGLVVVHRLVAAQGGHITVDCPADAGLRFTIQLPRG